MIKLDGTSRILLSALLVLLAGGAFIPDWAQNIIILALGKGLVVLGLMLLIRTGLVSFGQGLYYCLGAYAAASVGRIFHLPDSILTSDALLVPAVGGIVAGIVALILGFLLARYRAIFCPHRCVGRVQGEHIDRWRHRPQDEPPWPSTRLPRRCLR